MSSDPAAGAPVARAPAGARVDAARDGRICFELLAAIAIVGAAAAGQYQQAALVAVVLLLGGVLGRMLVGDRRRAHARGDARPQQSRPDARSPSSGTVLVAPFAERALSFFAAWFVPLALASAAAVLMRSGDVAHALTLLLAASPQALRSLPSSSRIGLRMLAAGAAAALLGAALAGFVGLVAAALLQVVLLLTARLVRD